MRPTRAALAASLLATLIVGPTLALARPSAHQHRQRIPVPPGTQASGRVGPVAFGNSSQVQRLHFRYGPLSVHPGTNMILLAGNIPRPKVNGYIVGLRPNLTLPDGTTPSVNVIHLHHGVWLNLSAHDLTVPSLPQRFFASGEEKTWMQLPRGYGYPFHTSDYWLLNYMLHNLTPEPFTVYIDYEVDFVPATAPLARHLRPAYPIWMDVENGSTYPIFNARRGTGTHGLFTFPNDATDPYGSGPALNEWKVPEAMTLVGVAGHLHPGGLYDTMELVRPGATPAAHGPVRGDVRNSVVLFRSQAHYWDPRGAVSWDMAMTKSPADYRVALKAGDTLRIDSTYDVSRQSWYEVMGIMIGFVAYGSGGADPFAKAVPTTGLITHGLLPENADPLGGVPVANLPNPIAEIGTTAPNDTVQINDFSYAPGDISTSLGGGLSDPPVVREGQSLQFVNNDNTRGIYHTITSCSLPCTATTGSHYPLADLPASTEFDSGELGTGPTGFTAASGRVTWKTPANLPTGTYTYFCRIHPFMRGTFRVIP